MSVKLPPSTTPSALGQVALDAVPRRHPRPRPGGLEPALVAGQVLQLADAQEHQRPAVLLRAPEGGHEGSPGALDALARSLGRDVEQVSDLSVREPGLEAQQQHEPLVGRESTQRLLGREVLVGVGATLVGALGKGGQVDEPSAAQFVDGQVGRGAVQPGGQPVGRQLTRRAAPRAQECLLTEVLGRLARPDHALQPAGEPAAVLLEDGVDAHAHRDERPAADRTP